MRTGEKTRVTFSEGRLDISAPTAWSELDQWQLDYALYALSHYGAGMATAMCLLRFSGIRPMTSPDAARGCVYLSLPRTAGSGRHGIVAVNERELAWAASQLAWLAQNPDKPVRLEMIDGHRAVAADWHGLQFGDYLAVDNFYQGYLATHDGRLLEEAARLLYRRRDGYPARRIRLNEHQTLGVVMWIASAKEWLARHFTDLFRKAGDGAAEPDMRKVMDAEIRALTDGDITKEAAVLRMDCWRALTELNAKAREARKIENMRQRWRTSNVARKHV